MILQKEREQVVDYCILMSDKGLSTGTSGNISVRSEEHPEWIALSPSGMDYHHTTPEDVVVIDLDGNIIDGARKPSSEGRLHTDFYKAKPDMYGIVHTHSMYCTVIGCLGEPLRESEVPVVVDARLGDDEHSPSTSHRTPPRPWRRRARRGARRLPHRPWRHRQSLSPV